MREKIIALFLTAIMATMLAAPAILSAYTLGSYSEPFCVAGDCTNFRIVYGSNAKAEDLAGGSDVIARLGGDSYTLVSTTGGAETTATGGDAARLDTASNRIIPGEALNNARTTITDTEMPNLLADGELQGDDGTVYPYTQDIQLGGNASLYFSDSDNDIDDPVLHIEMTPTSGAPAYTTRVTFSKAANISSSDLIDNTITLFGSDYTIGSGSDYNTVILYGGADSQVINEGEEITVTIGGTEYTVGVGGVSDADTAVISVDGVSESMDTGDTKKISGLDVYLSAVYYYPKEGQISQAKVSLGSQKITLENNDEVLVGTNTYIDETTVTVTGTAASGVTAFTISTPAQDSDEDSIQVGESYKDPVWGTFSLELSSTTPALDAAENDVLTIDGSSDQASIKFTDYNGYEKTINFAYDNNTASGSVSIQLMDSNGYTYAIAENTTIPYKHYVILDQADDTHLLQLSNVPGGAIKTTDILRFTDQFTGTLYEHTFTTSELGAVHPRLGCSGNRGANVSMRIGSQDYYVAVCNATSKSNSYVVITWDDTSSVSTDAGATYAVPGNIALFPQIKASNGEYVIFVNNYTYVPNASTVVLPCKGTTKCTEVINLQKAVGDKEWVEEQIPYFMDNTSLTQVRVVPEELKDYGAGIMILEEERANDKYEAIFIGITETGTTSLTTKVAQPTFSDNATTEATRQLNDNGPAFTTWASDTYYSSAINQWGTVVQYYNKDECEAVITYPDTQLYGDIFLLAEGATTTTTTTGEGTVKQAVPITWSVSLVDTDIQDPATVDYNLILVGGSCANSLVQQLVDDGKLDAKYTCTGGVGEGWETGKGYIWLIEDCFKTGQTCLVVAGTEKAQTKTACSVLQKYDTLLKDSTATAIEITSATTAGITPL